MLTSRKLKIRRKQFMILERYINQGRGELLSCDTDYFSLSLAGTPDSGDTLRNMVEG